MLDKVQEDRLRKLQAVRELGIDPYGGRYDTAEPAKNILERFETWEAANGGAEAAKSATPLRGDAAGRLILQRDMGKMMFCHIRDDSHPKGIQICLRKDQEGKSPRGLNEVEWKLAKLLDLGDILAVQGELHRTRTNEITIWADKLTLLTKSLNPMPEKWHGLSDVQARYRQRYLDLMSNPESLAVFQKRVAIIQNFRNILNAKGFLEVETPMMQSIYGGAAARPFTTHHNTLDMDLFMRISPELYLKRLLVGGMGKVFEINRNFRNEGIDTRHNPEFTMMELYQAYADYNVMMDITEELVSESANGMETPASLRSKAGRLKSELDNLLSEINGLVQDANETETFARELSAVGKTYAVLLERYSFSNREKARALFDQADAIVMRCNACIEAANRREQGENVLPYVGRVINYTRPWPRRKYADLLKECAGVEMRDSAAVRAKAKALGIEASNKDDAVVVNEVFEATVEPELAKSDRPTFVIDYPAEICPLTRRKSDDPSIALRFECFVAGMELANAYTELNDPAIQEENFRQQLRGEADGETMRVMDEDFVTALRHGMPPAGGLGVGIDRVIMLLTNTPSIRDVVLFPLLRPTEQ